MYTSAMNVMRDTSRFLPLDASAERGYEIAFVCLSVCNDQVPWSHRLEFFEDNLTAE